MKNSGIPLSSLPPRLQAQVREQLTGKPLQEAREKDIALITAVLNAPPPAKPRLRQSSKGPNKTEAAFGLWLAAQYPIATIDFEGITLKLANGTKYTPDWFVHFKQVGARPLIYEVKGFMESDAAVKLKVAAHVHQWADFYLVTKRGRTCGGWDIQHILP